MEWVTTIDAKHLVALAGAHAAQVLCDMEALRVSRGQLGSEVSYRTLRTSEKLDSPARVPVALDARLRHMHVELERCKAADMLLAARGVLADVENVKASLEASELCGVTMICLPTEVTQVVNVWQPSDRPTKNALIALRKALGEVRQHADEAVRHK